MCICILAFTLSACNHNTVYDKYIDIDDYIWHTDSVLKFEFEITDTLPLYDIRLNIRHATIYPYCNLWLFMYTSAPNGNIAVDTLQCFLADNEGRPLGDGLGDIFDLETTWKHHVRFPYKGLYRIECEQAMRLERLPGIMSIGITVETVDNK